MASILRRIAGPAFLASSVANIYTPPNSAIYVVIFHIHIVNVTTGAVKATLYTGATGAAASGTELMKSKSVPATDYIDYYCEKRMDSTDFLTGLASQASALVIEVEGEYRAT